MKVLSIGAHPDDPEFGMGGTLIKHRKEGHEVQVILCTLGGVCGDPKVREQEARAAANKMGVEVLHILDYHVSKLNKTNTQFVQVLRKVIDEIKPDRVYVHSPFDNHQVHKTVSDCTISAAKDLKQILFYETISSTSTNFKPNAFVDITSFMDLKIECIKAHKTQSHRLYLQPNVIRSVGNYRYIHAKVGSNPYGFAEAFRIHKMVI